MIDYSAVPTQEQQRRKHYWLVCGRALLTIAVLGLITTGLYYVSQTTHTDDTPIVDDSVTSRSRRSSYVNTNYQLPYGANSKSIEIIYGLSSVDDQNSEMDETENYPVQQRTDNNGNGNYVNAIKSDFSKINHDKLLLPTSAVARSNNNDDAGVDDDDDDEEVMVALSDKESAEDDVVGKNVVRRSLRSNPIIDNDRSNVQELGDNGHNHEINSIDDNQSRNDHKKSSQLKNGKKFPKYNKAQLSGGKHSGDGVNGTNNNNNLINSVNKSILPKNSTNSGNKMARNNQRRLPQQQPLHRTPHHHHQHPHHFGDDVENLNPVVDERTVIVTTYKCKHRTRKPWDRNGCNCHIHGSVGRTCDHRTGQCTCKPHVEGRTCDLCQQGFWNIDSNVGCIKCACSTIGSDGTGCDSHTGQCFCKPGVEGLNCDQCQGGHYGFAHHGCKRCDVCESPSYVCDAETGRCVCPTMSHGPNCKSCSSNSWGNEFQKGCKGCACDLLGSVGQTCDSDLGQCNCKEGFAGRQCDHCAAGYYGYPNCKRCGCDTRGSVALESGVFDCDETGQCPCKDLVSGLKCDLCRQATFGLAHFNPSGCTRCFCFGRSKECIQNDLSWGQIRAQGSRNLSVEYSFFDVENRRNAHQDYEYVVVIQIEGAKMNREDAEIKTKNNLNLIPSSTGNVSIGSYVGFYYPLYFQLPPQFLGDQIKSYGGSIKFALTTTGWATKIPEDILRQHPLIQIHSHRQLILDYYSPEIFETHDQVTYSVLLHETRWRYHYNGYNITRAILMTALQNVKHIFLRATTTSDFKEVVLSNATMDTGIYVEGATNNVAYGVEQCKCAEKYNGTSCQNAALGYYRWKNSTEEEEDNESGTTRIEDFIGHVIPCRCHRRSETCDTETGHCFNCRENTGGKHCEICAEGYYGNPAHGQCQPCPCPETRKNFARGCTVRASEVSCICKEGYTGRLCDQCMGGFYGSPHLVKGSCESCDCNSEGIKSHNCEALTGQCDCKPGVTGKRCDQCVEVRHVLQDNRCKLCDNCTLTLLDTLDDMLVEMDHGASHIDQNGIPAPWFELQKYINQSEVLDDRLEHFYVASKQIENFNETAVDKITAKAKNVKTRSGKLNNKIEKRAQEVERILTSAEDLLADAKLYNVDITNTIKNLNLYGTNDHHIKLPQAMRDANEYLDDIKLKLTQYNQSDAPLLCARKSFKYWTNASFESESINIGRNNLELSLHELQDKLKDLEKHGHRTLSTVDSADETHTKNDERYENLKNKLDEIQGFEADVEDKLNTSLISQSETTLVMIQDNLKNIDVELLDILILKKTMNETVEEVKEALIGIQDNDLPKSKKYAAELMEKSNSYTQLFQNTKNGAEIAMLASTAHQNISEAIQAAKEAAQQALIAVKEADEHINPEGEMSISDWGLASIHDSQEIEQEALNEIEKLNDLEENLLGHEKIIDNVKTAIWQAGLDNNKIASSVKQANNETMKEVRAALDTSMKVSDQMKEVRREAVDINSDVYKLKQKLADLEPDWEAKLGMAAENISNTRSNIRAANSTLNSIEMQAAKHNEKIKAWNDTMSAQLKALRDKIAQAKHAADGIRVSIESKDPKCIRSYMPSSFGPTTSTSIVLSIALNTKDGNSPLVFIQGEDNKFIALEMIKRKIRMLWNFGGDTQVVTHRVEIETRDPKYDDAWYQIEANRTMNVGSLNVRRMTSAGELEPSAAISGASQPAFSRLTFDISNRIWVGGVPDDIRPKDLLNANGLNVVLSQLSVDQKQIGLWSYAHSEGSCEGAMLGPHESGSASNTRHFNGEGYSVVGRRDSNKLVQKLYFSVQMSFKTLDENALLFLAVDEINNRSVSLTLFEGRIVFRIDYGGESKLEINTTKKYNTGEWVKVEASRAYTSKGNTEEGVLKVNSLEPEFGSPTAPITQNMIPDFKSSLYYLGGVPPGFQSGSTKAPGADYAFLGCMKDVQINGDNYDPRESSQFYGVEPSCKDRITRAGFYGDGFIELPSYSLKRTGNIGFVFRTLQPDALLLLSAYPPSVNEHFDSHDVRGNYSISLVNGRVFLWMDAGKGRIELSSNVTLNDGEYHVLNVVKRGRRIDLRVNDELQMTKNLPSSPVALHAPEEHGGLFIGGVPDFGFEFDFLAPTFIRFEGAIKDLVFNNKTVSFHEALNFTKVHLGRIGPSMGSQGLQMALMKTEPISRSFKATPEGCHRVGSYSYETNAFKFGDGMFSHSIVNVASRHLWQKNFNIQFDFRTFYPNGVLLAAPGTKEKQKHFIVLALRDGILSLIVRGRRKQSLSLPLKLNDGQWHRVMLHSVDRKVTLGIEFGNSKQYSSAQIRLPKKLNASNMMFIGGIAENSLTLPQELVAKLEGFKGCIRKLIINNSTQDLAKPGRHHNVGQCFPRVEKGAYFPGDAYAVYKRNFNFGKYLELELEFRTSDLNGILISIAEPMGFPALSLELNNGNIVMSCDLGDGNPFRVETALASKYALCDNQWHNITALYESEQIAIRIDSQSSIIALAHRMSGKVHSKSPLYIGGLPETAPTGTLLLRENFKGCIRNVVVRNELRDWTDMDSLHNVLLSECLTVH